MHIGNEITKEEYIYIYIVYMCTHTHIYNLFDCTVFPQIEEIHLMSLFMDWDTEEFSIK